MAFTRSAESCWMQLVQSRGPSYWNQRQKESVDREYGVPGLQFSLNSIRRGEAQTYLLLVTSM